MSKTAPHKGEFRVVILPNGDVLAPDLTQPLLPIIEAVGGSPAMGEEIDCVVDFPILSRTRRFTTEITRDQLGTHRTEQLLEIHDRALNSVQSDTPPPIRDRESNDATLLDLKIEIARRQMESCELCEHRCGTNRHQGQLGFCRLSDQLDVAGYSNLYNEGQLVGQPTFGVYVRGCSLRCCFCYREEDLKPKSEGETDPEALAKILDDAAVSGSKSWHFLGGNPDESLFGILKSLRHTKNQLPIVWNSAFYLTPVGVQLLKGVVDIWLPDFKFGNDQCATKIAKINRYTEIIQRNLLSISDQPHVIVRHMTYPGHEQCCELIVKQWIRNNLPQVRTHWLKHYAQ